MQVGASDSVPAVATVGLCKFSTGASTSEKRRIECGLATLAGERERMVLQTAVVSGFSGALSTSF